MMWRDIATAPKDGTWILGMNNAGRCAVIIWSTNALRRKMYPIVRDGKVLNAEPERQFDIGEGWIFPFSLGEVSPFWEGHRVKYWMPLPPPPAMAPTGEKP